MGAMNVVYKLKTPDGRFYVGSSGNLTMRMASHFSELRLGKHGNKHLQQAFNEGLEFSLDFWVLENRDAAYDREDEIIKEYIGTPALMNICPGSRSNDGFTYNPDKEAIRLKFSKPGVLNGMFGRNHTEETKRRISELNKGKPGNLGYRHDIETKAILSELAKLKLGELNPFYGKQHSDETKQKIREARLGNKPANTNCVEIDGVVYESQTSAAKALGVALATITFRLKSPNKRFANYRVIAE